MAEYPTGTATFLFTDIEGSTQLERRLRNRYREVLEQHQRLLRESFAAHNGYEVDTQGDSFFVAFGRARDAVAAAIQAQKALARFEWPEGTAVRVRMGLHTGEAEVDDGRYIGHAVHRAARIAAAAHGGQILLSRPTRDLVEDDLPPHQRVRDLGEHRLKDLPRAEHLYQLVVEDLPTEFPPPRTLEQQELAQAAQAAVHRRRSRRSVAIALVAGAVLGFGGLGAAASLLRGDGGVDVAPNAVAVIDPEKNSVVATVPVGAAPGPVAAGQGAIWVGNIGDRTLSRVDLRSLRVATVTLENRSPTAVAVGEGAVWVAHDDVGAGSAYGDLISKVDPGFNRVVATIEVTEARTVAAGGGAVWAVGGGGTVTKISPRMNAVVKVGNAASGGTDAEFRDGTLWVAGGANHLSVVNATTVLPGPPLTVGFQPSAIALGSGSAWVTATQTRTVSRVAATRPFAAVIATIPVGDEPTDVAYGEGAVWVVNSASGTVSRVDPRRNAVVSEVEVGHRPRGVVVAAGRVWVSVQERD